MHPFLFFDLSNYLGNSPIAQWFPRHVTYTWFVMIMLALLSYLATRRLSLYPSGLQNVMETIIEAVNGGIEQIMGHEGKRYFPLIGSLAVFILVSNLVGVLPGFDSATNNYNTTLSMAIVVFFMTHIVGIRMHGVKYVKHFMGGSVWLAPLMVPIEIISHFSRPLSLSVRLFGNIMGEDLVVAIVAMLVPFLVPVPLFVLMIFTSVIQTMVFVILTMIYISLAIEEAH